MLLKQFDDLADQVIEAIVADAANPDIRASIQNQLDRFASGLIGRDVNTLLLLNLSGITFVKMLFST